MTEQVEEKVKRPASQYYWANWLSDKALQSCTLPARGMWHEMNCWMHQSDPYGHLYLNGKVMTTAKLANLVRIGERECKKLVAELEDAGVFSRDGNGAIFSRRMVRDEAIREARAAGGQAGAEHGAKGAKDGLKGGRPKAVKGGYETPLTDGSNPPPSSSSASSPAGLFQGSDEPLVPAEPPPCPTQRLLVAFTAKVPELPKPRKELWDGSAGADAMRQRWKWLLTASRGDGTRYATSTEEGVDWFGRFFDSVAESDLLMGRLGKWRADLAWLMKRENFSKVVQGNYKNKDGT